MVNKIISLSPKIQIPRLSLLKCLSMTIVTIAWKIGWHEELWRYSTSEKVQKLQLGLEPEDSSSATAALCFLWWQWGLGKRERRNVSIFWSLPDQWEVLSTILTKFVEHLELEKYLSGKSLFSRFHSICSDGQRYHCQQLLLY